MPRWDQTGPTDWRARDDEARAARAELASLCAHHGLPLPWGPYRAAAHTCFKCDARTVVYTWVGHVVRSGRAPPEPHPRTVVRRKTSQSGGISYWVNTCAQCGIAQGDNYLYDEAGSGGLPPFRFTWSRPLPAVPGGPVATPSSDEGEGGVGVNPWAAILGWGRRGPE